jgi:hypothetical protein
MIEGFGGSRRFDFLLCSFLGKRRGRVFDLMY